MAHSLAVRSGSDVSHLKGLSPEPLDLRHHPTALLGCKLQKLRVATHRSSQVSTCGSNSSLSTKGAEAPCASGRRGDRGEIISQL
jgi:hypothetical protein